MGNFAGADLFIGSLEHPPQGVILTIQTFFKAKNNIL